jgi:hypothetical protein
MMMTDTLGDEPRMHTGMEAQDARAEVKRPAAKTQPRFFPAALQQTALDAVNQ